MIESFLLPERILKKYKASNIKITIFKLRKKYEEMLSKYLSSNGDRKHDLCEKKHEKIQKYERAPKFMLIAAKIISVEICGGIMFLEKVS